MLGPLETMWELYTRGEIDTPMDKKDVLKYIAQLRERLRDVTGQAMRHAADAQAKYKRQYDKTSSYRKLEPGDQAFIQLPTSAHKLYCEWYGPFKILRRVDQCNYGLQDHMF